MCYARGDSDSRRDLADRAYDDAEVLGAPPLAEPYRAQAEALGGLSLADHGAGIGDTSGKHVGPERRTAQPTVVHDRYSDSSVQYSGKGFGDGVHLNARRRRRPGGRGAAGLVTSSAVG